MFCTLILIDVVQIASGEGCRCCSSPKSKWYQPREFALTGGANRNQTSRAVTRCASSCLQNDNCTSFKYCEDDKFCQLNSAVQPDNETALQPSGQCVYYEDKLQNAWKNPPRKVAGALKHVSIGEAGVWGIGVKTKGLYYKRWCGSSWTLVPGTTVMKLKQIDVGKNVIWGSDNGHNIYYSTVSAGNPDITSWTKTSGGLVHVSVSQKGHVWGCIVNQVYHRTGVSFDNPGGVSWKMVGNGIIQISVGAGGVWGIAGSNKISYRVGTYGDPDSDTDGAGWENVESSGISLKYVSSGNVIYVVDTDDVIYYRVGTSAETPTGTAWQKIGGNLKQIDSISGTLWGVDAENNVYTNEA